MMTDGVVKQIKQRMIKILLIVLPIRSAEKFLG